jgi:uncharacterized membrane protein YhaH (DUF805 family)
MLSRNRRGVVPGSGWESSMNFTTAVQSVLSQYVGFSGRARRSEYWYFFLFNVIVSVVFSIIDAIIGSQILGIIVSLALLLPGLAVTLRRLHDTDRTGWWIWIALIPIVGVIVLIVFLCKDSDPAANKYGASPKFGAGPAYGGSGVQYPGGAY